jgi:hypothetical protein
MKRWVATAVMVLGLLGVAVAPAYADPTKAPHALTFPITCGGTTYTVVEVPGSGLWVPVLVTDSHQVIVPFAFDVTFVDLATGDTDSVQVSKKARNPLATQSCSFDVTVTEEGFRFFGTVVVLLTPPAG